MNKKTNTLEVRKLNEELKKISAFNVTLLDEQVKLNKEIRNLNHQIIGYRAVIDYLEFQIAKFNK